MDLALFTLDQLAQYFNWSIENGQKIGTLIGGIAALAAMRKWFKEKTAERKLSFLDEITKAATKFVQDMQDPCGFINSHLVPMAKQSKDMVEFKRSLERTPDAASRLIKEMQNMRMSARELRHLRRKGRSFSFGKYKHASKKCGEMLMISDALIHITNEVSYLCSQTKSTYDPNFLYSTLKVFTYEDTKKAVTDILESLNTWADREYKKILG